MVRKPVDVIRDDDIQSRMRAINFADFQDLHIVAENFRSHLKWCDVNYLDFRVFESENSA